jgi:hypothetical protein
MLEIAGCEVAHSSAAASDPSSAMRSLTSAEVSK